ncbi:VTT domain-containing protein [Streptococcus gallinaceus]|uniref:Membrane-associated protein n=1 Tax=Streptococcus gallinaceus TaxID=165758 RepID=A0ABV2JHR7_9STRE|nr:VTT domain-containing protein [Streptococcus gallinaceus]MCP1640160.1 membrane-associated protein [Streptococcus gallinaceus]MCP1770942.1 membrane-associated protein [Streptococcus gallinaceus]
MFIIDFILHIDQHIYAMANAVGPWTYLLLFLVIFVETGAVILPFLPGDSLLFAAGALAANPNMSFNVWIFGILFFLASILGDTLNFFIGHTFGYQMVRHPFFSRFIKEQYIQDAEEYFEEKGSAAIILGRYIPIVRTFVPFVAGVSQFPFKDFFIRAFIAAVSWSIIATGAGYLFGNIPFVKSHFSLIIITIVLVTLLPMIIPTIKKIVQKHH